MESIITAIITGGLALIGVVFSNLQTSSKTDTLIKINQAVTDTKLEALTQKVQEYNDFARRVPVLEEQVKVINHRIADLEHK